MKGRTMIDVKQRGAWFGDPEFKDTIVALMHEHRAKDRFMQGAYRQFGDEEGDNAPWTLENFRGCAIGCLVTSKRGLNFIDGGDWHLAVEEEFNIPFAVAWNIDCLFEAHPTFEEAGTFAVASVEAIPVGANLNELTAQLGHANWHGTQEDYSSSGCPDCILTHQLRTNAELFLKELSNAPLMPAARAVILAG